MEPAELEPGVWQEYFTNLFGKRYEKVNDEAKGRSGDRFAEFFHGLSFVMNQSMVLSIAQASCFPIIRSLPSPGCLCETNRELTMTMISKFILLDDKF